MRGRLLNGKFQSPFNPAQVGRCLYRGNAWHYTWSVFHDPEGLIRLMGGKEKFNQMLDSVFLLPPVFDNSYYGFTIHEIRDAGDEHGQLCTRQPAYPARHLSL